MDYGTGGNGKGKFHGAIMNALGPYAVVPHKSLLVAEKHEQHATVVASLFRARCAVASETKARCTLNEEMIKNLTGGDRLGARRIREDEWWFNPSHTMILSTNYEPVIKGTDNGIWRRVRLVPWKVTIQKEDEDPDLADKLKAESSGILNWIIEGARIFLKEGWEVPEFRTGGIGPVPNWAGHSRTVHRGSPGDHRRRHPDGHFRPHDRRRGVGQGRPGFSTRPR